jgi:hypothetical protein
VFRIFFSIEVITLRIVHLSYEVRYDPHCLFILPVTYTKISLAVLCGSLTALMETQMEQVTEQRNVENIWTQGRGVIAE